MQKLSTAQTASLLLGNLFDHYDTALYGLLSPFLAPLFFPQFDPISALILTYGIILLGMFAKPLGSLLFGYIGDSVSRSKALCLSLTGMGMVSLGFVLIPTYDEIGVFAPFLLCLLRILQNIFSAGELIGGSIYFLENTSESKKDFASSLYSASTVAGILLGSLAVTALCAFSSVEKSWRLLYLIGSTTAFFALFLRMSEPITKNLPKKESLNIFITIWTWRKEVLSIAIVGGFSYATYSLALVLMNGLVPILTSSTKEQMIQLNTFLLVFDILLLPFCGWLTRFVPRHLMMLQASLCGALTALPLFYLLDGASFGMIIAIRMTLVTIGVWFSATFHSWSQSLIPSRVKGVVVSSGYALGTQIIGGPTAMLSLFFYHRTGIPALAGLYWLLVSLAVSIVMLRFTQDKQTVQLPV